MRIIQEIKVECATEQEYTWLVDWIEEQSYCTVEFNAVQRKVAGAHVLVSITPWGHEGDTKVQFEEFCTELAHAVRLTY